MGLGGGAGWMNEWVGKKEGRGTQEKEGGGEQTGWTDDSRIGSNKVI